MLLASSQPGRRNIGTFHPVAQLHGRTRDTNVVDLVLAVVLEGG